MAEVKHGRIVSVESVGPGSCLVTAELEKPLGFRGGQYVIIDSGELRENGKPGKRAYSMLSTDGGQSRVEFAVQSLPNGLCSGYMNQLKIGDALRFSGPWGKFKVPAEKATRTLVVASDTGITAALSLLVSAELAASVPQTEFVWFRVEPRDFLSDEFVRSRLPTGLAGAQILPCPCVHHPERLIHVSKVVRELVAKSAPERAYISGDGDLTYGLMPALQAAGVAIGREQIESFFNSPKKT